MRCNIIDIAVTLRRETALAVQVSDGGKPVWLPKSQVEVGLSDDGQSVIVTLPEWLAAEKGLI